jgi:hypothetical protein
MEPEGLIESNWDEVCENFDDMNLKEELLRGIYAYGFEKPSAIQQRAIVPCIKGMDVIAQAQSGTGKTATFSISILQQIDTNLRECQALILAPTRELAQQIQKVVMALGDYMGAQGHACIGGTSVRNDMRKLDVGQHIVVGTPGCVFDMISRKFLRPNEIVIYESLKFEGKLRGRKRYKGQIIYSIRYRDARERGEGERAAPFRSHKTTTRNVTLPPPLSTILLLPTTTTTPVITIVTTTTTITAAAPEPQQQLRLWKQQLREPLLLSPPHPPPPAALPPAIIDPHVTTKEKMASAAIGFAAATMCRRRPAAAAFKTATRTRPWRRRGVARSVAAAPRAPLTAAASPLRPAYSVHAAGAVAGHAARNAGDYGCQLVERRRPFAEHLPEGRGCAHFSSASRRAVD